MRPAVGVAIGAPEPPGEQAAGGTARAGGAQRDPRKLQTAQGQRSLGADAVASVQTAFPEQASLTPASGEVGGCPLFVIGLANVALEDDKVAR